MTMPCLTFDLSPLIFIVAEFVFVSPFISMLRDNAVHSPLVLIPLPPLRAIRALPSKSIISE